MNLLVVSIDNCQFSTNTYIPDPIIKKLEVEKDEGEKKVTSLKNLFKQNITCRT